MSPIQLGFVGLSKQGWAATALVPSLTQPGLVEHFTIRAVSTRSATSAIESAQKWTEQQGHEVKAYHGDTAKIAADKNVDVVAVAVKVMSHQKAAVPAIEAGKDVFVEWPLGNGYAETVELARLAKSKGIKTMVGLQGWTSPQARKIKEIVDSGKIGRVLSTTLIATSAEEDGYWGSTMPESLEYTADANNGATMLDILGGHMLSVFVRALNDVASVSSTTKNQYTSSAIMDASGKPTGRIVPNTGAHHVAFSGTLISGAVYSIHLSLGPPKATAPIPFLWMINGSEGSIRVEGPTPFVQIIPPKVFLNGTEVEVEDPLGSIGRSWYEFASGGDGDYPTFEDAVRVHAIIDAVYRSADEKRVVELH